MTRFIPLLLIAMTLGGCASNPSNGPVYDPLERINRPIYTFNTKVDDFVLAPVARGYRFITPNFLESGIRNFFNNLDEITTITNDVLQGKFRQAGSDTGRFLLNSTVGVLGIFDIGTRVGLVRHNESFGQTFGVWGIGEGAFLMLPLLGPNNGRSTAGLVVEQFTTDPIPYLDDFGTELALNTLDIISLRATLLAAGNLFNAAALDPYLLLRDFWVQQHRRATCDDKCDSRLGTAGDGNQDDLDELDELDELDQLDDTDELDELDQLDAADELDELDQLDALDESDPVAQ